MRGRPKAKRRGQSPLRQSCCSIKYRKRGLRKMTFKERLVSCFACGNKVHSTRFDTVKRNPGGLGAVAFPQSTIVTTYIAVYFWFFAIHDTSGSKSGVFKKTKKQHTTAGIRWSSPTQLLIRPLPAWLWESGRDPVYSGRYGRMYSSYHQLYLI